jgi:uncharacterized protein (TIGR02246 family)
MEEIMMLRSLSMAMLAVSLAAPAFAQQTTGSQQDVRQQIEAWSNKWVEAYNKGDAKAVLAMADPKACAINPRGMVCGSQKIEGLIQDVLKLGPHFTLKVDEVQPIGKDSAMAAGSYRVTFTNNPARSEEEGNWLRVFERRGNDWMTIASSFTPLAAPAPGVATGTTAPQPATGTSTPPAPAPRTTR